RMPTRSLLTQACLFLFLRHPRELGVACAKPLTLTARRLAPLTEDGLQLLPADLVRRQHTEFACLGAFRHGGILPPSADSGYNYSIAYCSVTGLTMSA